ncbi:hypothetical protein [Brucella pseudogrignonensis]|uniref:hypothetical protein n=1 Tax=Brucella pseudogrignonensis TaxID=419475 RepID=UPI000CFB5B73|nr:hypothetical protein [Brucella pseudogrignonensis]MQP38757.1 hypothetical protein [Ochrobactrum sp. MYb237]PQZ43374.1 hypothetical protein CQ059_05435 [Brucella pseudogrignonensis]PRA43121.1 hypothetical protein CQ063_01920 [Brucella pseudogrignonensis]PRA72409.1 hypothetical protein CQ055_03660 [Brucella pseudogrignonensis]
MKIIDVLALKWLNPEQTLLGGSVLTADLGTVPICIHAGYDTQEGLQLWNDAIGGKYGPVFSYAPEPELTGEEARALMPDLPARQFWLAALSVGITEDSLVEAISDPSSSSYLPDPVARQEAIIDIRKATSFSRSYPTLNKLATAQGIPAEQLDALWIWATSI